MAPTRTGRGQVPWLALVTATGAVLAGGGVLLSSVGGDDGESSRSAIEVSMVEYAYGPVEIHAHPGQELAITNDGAISHNFVVPELGKGIELTPGDAGMLPVPTDASGTYAVICDLSGHREAGMVGTLVVG